MAQAAAPETNGRVAAGASYDEFFQLLRDARAWGLYAFQVKNGDVVKLTISRSFNGIDEALTALADHDSIDARLIRVPERD